MRFEVDGPAFAGEGDLVVIGDPIRRGDLVWFDRVEPQKLVMRVVIGAVQGMCYRIDCDSQSDFVKLVAEVQKSKAAPLGSEEREALERFVVGNDDLLSLESRIGRFNIFDALGITRVEIRHSNFLAFILDPAESHGQGQLFLEAILMDLLKNAPAELRPLSPIALDGTNLRGIDVKREWKNIDLLITCKEPQFALVIENKVDSRDHSNQLNRYSDAMKQGYPDLEPLYVYLTPDGDDPSEQTEKTWLPYRYEDICRVLSRVRDTYQNAIGDEVLIFLNHYLNLLGTQFMKDTELDELCRQIYKKHRKALDLIWKRGTPEPAVLRAVVNVLETDDRWRLLHHTREFVDFVPKSWLDWLPLFGDDDDYPFGISIWLDSGNLVHSIFVGPMVDATQRAKIVMTLREKMPSIGFKQSKASQVTGKWSRVSAQDTMLECDDDAELKPEKIRGNVQEKLNQLFTKLDKLVSVLKPLCKPSTTTT